MDADYPEHLLAREPAPPYEGEGPFALWHFSEDPSLDRFRPHEVGGYWVTDEPVEAIERVIVDDLAGRHAAARICTVSTPPPTSRVPHESTAAAARLASRPADWSTV